MTCLHDFNVDFSRTDRRRTNDLLQFTNSLIAKDLDFPDVQFTYKSDNGLRRSLGGSCTDLSNLCTMNTGNYCH